MRNDIYRKIRSRINDTIFADFNETIWAYLKSTNVKGENFDPFRNTGYTSTNQSPLPVKASVRQIVAESRIVKELGQVALGGIEIVIKNQDKNLIQIAEKIKYKDREYCTFNKSLGNKVQITEISFGYYRIVLYAMGK